MINRAHGKKRMPLRQSSKQCSDAINRCLFGDCRATAAKDSYSPTLKAPPDSRRKGRIYFVVKNVVVAAFVAVVGLFLAPLFQPQTAFAQSNLTFRVMAANISSGNNQSYEAPGIRIFQGLKPDIVAIQEFRYNSSASDGQLRQLVDTAFGTNFYFYREPYTAGGDIPNGIVSRWPIIAAGSWDDSEAPNRGFAWAQIDLPGTNDLYVVSVHLLTSNSGTRNAEATQLKSLIQANFPANAWIIVAGDMNTDSRSEAAINTFKTFLSDAPVPTDSESGGNDSTNANRNKPYDYLLPSFSLTNYLVPVTLPSRTFPKGLVFDSRVYTPLSDVAPVQSGDSGVSGMQHMAVIKDFTIPVESISSPPVITTQPQSQTNTIGGTAEFFVTATGTTPLHFQWRFNGTNLVGVTATNLVLSNLQPANAGDYTVVITNSLGSVTSSIATLTVTTAPVITNQPESLSVTVGANALFSVGATGLAPLSYQWRFEATDIPGATNSTYTRTNAQLADAGGYSVVITNSSGSVTSAIAVLTVNQISTGELVTLAGWDVSGLSNFGPSLLLPSTNAPNVTVVGLTRGSGIGTSGSAAANAWGGTGFDSTTAAAAIAAQDVATCSITANSGFTVSFTSISRFDYRRSGTGPANGVLQYQIAGGAFIDIAALNYSSSAGSGASIAPIDLSGISALQSVPAGNTVTFRIVNYGGATGGTWYLYNVVNSSAPDFAIDGIVNPIVPPGPPAIAPTLTNATWNGTQFQFTLIGTPTSNYVVQATTNLNDNAWTSLQTNAAPFLFIETNALDLPQRFYRGQVTE